MPNVEKVFHVIMIFHVGVQIFPNYQEMKLMIKTVFVEVVYWLDTEKRFWMYRRD